ncbi:BON domain-containing protein [Lacimicrobium alkaliphilum]|uniref:BON domain-containing protein n=1 Tax=Lacimicrobium alkaliphilum TaxID=1526571 RepID=A0A0U3B3C2_9ALTE|nr:BON domain-containing protein [Lacimicrobium alkaliphilum]ALS99720.1 hypothetical protein AT746_16565 [Lacimicrobium alkaliphilum]
MILRQAFCALLLTLPLIAVTACDNMTETKTQPQKIDDNSLSQAVSEVLERDALSARSNIKVTSLDGKVSLTGTVASAEDKTHATGLVKKVNGVKTVNNDLEITTPADSQ